MNQRVDEIELAKCELTRRLTPYIATERAWSIGADYVTDLLARGWRPPLDRPPKPSRKGDYARGAALARELLAQRLQSADAGDSIPDRDAEAPRSSHATNGTRGAIPACVEPDCSDRLPAHTRPGQHRCTPMSNHRRITRRGQLGPCQPGMSN